MPKKQLFLCFFLPGLAYCVIRYSDHFGNFVMVMVCVTIVAYAFSQLFGEKESEVTNNNAFDLTKELAKLDKLKSEVNKGTLETNNNAFDLTTELAKLDKLKKDGLISAEDYEVLKKRAIEKAKE